MLPFRPCLSGTVWLISSPVTDWQRLVHYEESMWLNATFTFHTTSRLRWKCGFTTVRCYLSMHTFLVKRSKSRQWILSLVLSHKTAGRRGHTTATCCQSALLLLRFSSTVLLRKHVFSLLYGSAGQTSAVGLKPLHSSCLCWVCTYIHCTPPSPQ